MIVFDNSNGRIRYDKMVYWLVIIIYWVSPCVGMTVELLHINDSIVSRYYGCWLVVETNNEVDKTA